VGTAALAEQPDPDNLRREHAELREFRLELGLPVWTYVFHDQIIEKRVVMPHRQNTVFITYTRKGGAGPLRLVLDPWIHFRPHEGSLASPIAGEYAVRMIAGHYEIENTQDVGLPPPRLKRVGGDGQFAST